MITLKQSVELMGKIKDRDINNEIEIIVKNGHFVLQEKLVKISKGGTVSWK